MSTDVEQITDLEQQWAAAEVAGDTAVLNAITVPEFALVGPLGFVLDKSQWSHRYAGGGLVTRSLDRADVTVRVMGDTAITIGEHVQQASYRGSPADGRFRSTHVYVRTGQGWRLAGMHLSPIQQAAR